MDFRLEAHIDQEIAAIGGTRHHVQHWMLSEMSPGNIWRGPEFFLPPINSERAYWIALHEIGHAYTLPTMGLPWLEMENKRLDYEAQAWEWALEHSLIGPTDEAWAVIYGGLASHAADSAASERTTRWQSLRDEAYGRIGYRAAEFISEFNRDARNLGKRELSFA